MADDLTEHIDDLFEAFQRQYKKVLNLPWSKLQQGGGVSFEFAFDGSGAREQVHTPDRETITRLAALMCPFLLPDNRLHYAHMWTIIQQHFPADITDA